MAEETKRRGINPELKAMARIDRILSEFDADERERILLWVSEKHSRRIWGEEESHADY